LDPADRNTLNETMNRMWTRFLPELLGRLDALEVAAAALSAGALSAEQRQRAVAAAHNLAGVLGTFGLAEGSVLARKAEELCTRADGTDHESTRLEVIAAELSSLISNRKEIGSA